MTIAASARRHFDANIVLVALIVLIVIFGLSTENFFSADTVSTIINQLPPLIVVTIGMTLVLIVGGIDLSVGSVVALSGAMVGLLMTSFGLPLWLGFIAGLATGLTIGAINGWFVGAIGLPSFIVTLGMLEAARGLAYLTTGSQTIFIGPSIQFLSLPISGIGVSPALMIAVVILIIAHIGLTRTIAGRHLIATGTSEPAARVSGIDTHPYRIGVFALAGLLSGLGGLFNASYLAAADPNAGTGLELVAIAAAVIGGTSLTGGRGSIAGAMTGILIIAVLQSGLAQLGLSEPMKRLMTGGVIIFAVLFDHWRARHIRTD